MGRVTAVCTSKEKGTQKRNAGTVNLIAGHGIEHDAHAGNWHRQVSLLSYDKIENFKARGAEVIDGDFGENIIAMGVDFKAFPIGTLFGCNDVLLELTQIGKECHAHCKIYETMGDCIMPREGVFAKVITGGSISVGDELIVLEKLGVSL